MDKQFELNTPKGFRDLLPKQANVRKKVKEILINVFESFGFEPLETPTLEYQRVLLGKYGEEADKLVYKFEDPGQRKVGLRYDLTVPLARVVAKYKESLTFPFKRYQIQSVFRADKPQKGRYREFTQCDIDTVGSSSPWADAEIIAIIEKSLQKLGFPEFIIRLNSRQVLFSIIEKVGISANKSLSVIQSIDKLDKKTKEEVEKELSEKGIATNTIKNIFSSLKSVKPDSYLKEVIASLADLKVKQTSWIFDPTLARGLDYYTGPIFETVVSKPKIGSITGGGRYDNLLKLLGGIDLPATGTTIGLDRVVDVILEQNLWPEVSTNTSQVLVSIFNPSLSQYSLNIANNLRNKGIKTEVYLNYKDKLSNQFKFADKKGIQYVVIAGPDEYKNQKITVKDLKTGKQQTLDFKEVISFLRSGV